MLNGRRKRLIKEGWRQFRNAIFDVVAGGGHLGYNPIPILVVGTLAVTILTLFLTILSIVVGIIW